MIEFPLFYFVLIPTYSNFATSFCKILNHDTVNDRLRKGHNQLQR